MTRVYRQSFGSRLFDVGNVILIFAIAMSALYPFVYMAAISTSDFFAVGFGKVTLIPVDFSLEIYTYLFQYNPFIARAYYNSILYTVLNTALTVILCGMAGFALAQRRLAFRGFIGAALLVSMFFSGGLIPTYLLIRGLGLLNNLWVLVLPQMFNVFYMIIMRNYLMAAHLEELEEAALVDGGGYPYILFRIMVPLSMPLLATVSLWVAVAHWNEWFYARIYLTGNRFLVLQYLLQRLIEHHRQDEQVLNDYVAQTETEINTANVVAGTMILTIGPIVLLYPFLQKYFVKGVMIGSLKG